MEWNDNGLRQVVTQKLFLDKLSFSTTKGMSTERLTLDIQGLKNYPPVPRKVAERHTPANHYPRGTKIKISSLNTSWNRVKTKW